MQGTQSYVYWKRPWAKWCLLVAGLLQLLALWMSLSDYWEVSSVWDHIMSEDAWKSYASQTILSCSIKAFTAALFFGILIVGGAARSEKAARRSTARRRAPRWATPRSSRRCSRA